MTAIDAALVLQFVAGLLDDLPCEKNADANGDEDISASDATLILQPGSSAACRCNAVDAASRT